MYKKDTSGGCEWDFGEPGGTIKINIANIQYTRDFVLHFHKVRGIMKIESESFHF